MLPLRICGVAALFVAPAIVPATPVAVAPAGPVARAASVQDVRGALFAEADRALEAARQARADVLAPKSFGEGMKHYRKAEDDLKRGRNLEGIRASLGAAAEQFRKATEATRLAAVTLSTAIAARDDALNAEAPKFAGRLWAQAEKKFEEGARRLEEGDVNDAKRRGGEAERIYRDAELEAIKGNYLNETLELLARADKQDVEDRAPRTLQRAQELARAAEKQLTENRYDTDEPRTLAQEAKREARHAIYPSQRIREIQRGGQTMEDLVLSTEEPIRRIAAAMDVPVSFEAGLGEPTEAILRRWAEHEDNLQSLRSSLVERDQQIAVLEARVNEVQEQVTALQGRLGGVEEQRSELARRIEEQARLRERFASVERMFTREEARVLREGNDVILRLTGLTFPVARSTIDPKYFTILTKVQQAIMIFPDCTVEIEGYTDSFGSDEANLQLSQERAEAVRQYLLANMAFSASRMEAVGHGETRPIASNETAEGRARNRRIDVVIHPGAAAGP